MQNTSNTASNSAGGSNNSVNPGSTVTNRKASGKSGTSNAAQPRTAATPSTSSFSSSKWKLVRPWQPPHGSSRSAEAALEDGASQEEQQHESMQEDDEEAEDSTALSTTFNSRKRMHLEVVDVSSTSVSLSVFGQPASHDQQQQQQQMDTALGSTSSSAHQTTLTRRSRAASSYSERAPLNPPQPPNISIKLNSAAWPHVFHTDASFFDTDSTRHSQDDQGMSASSILVWGLSPGQNYHIELGVFEDGMDEDDDPVDVDDLSEVSDTEESLRAAASVRTLDATEPDVPPPPYSSHDPSSGHAPHNDAEVSLRNVLDKLRASAKQKEGSLQSTIASMRRANDKLTREDQRHRQRIHMLEDSTSRLREVAADEEAEYETIKEQVDELGETEKTIVARLERRRSQLESMEKQAKEETDKEDAELAELKERLDKASEREEEVLAKKLKLERELLPTYNIQLATLEADLRRLVDDHRRRFPYQHHVPQHGFGGHMNHSNINHAGHAAHGSHNVRTGRDRMQARAVQHQQAQQHLQSQQQLPPMQQQQQHPHAHQQQLQQQQQTQSQNTEQMRQGMSPGVRLHTRTTPPESPALENAMAGPSRQNSSGMEESRASIATGENVSSHVLSSSKEQETAQPGNQTLMPPSTRVGSRFGWSNPNSWASKVAGGGGAGAGAKGGNAGVSASTSTSDVSKRQEMAE